MLFGMRRCRINLTNRCQRLISRAEWHTVRLKGASGESEGLRHSGGCVAPRRNKEVPTAIGDSPRGVLETRLPAASSAIRQLGTVPMGFWRCGFQPRQVR